MSRYFFSLKDSLNMIKQLLNPDEMLEGVEHISVEELYQKGLRVMILDIDNTILPYSERSVSLQKRSWVKKVKAMGFSVLIISNNSSQRRIERVARELDVPGINFAMKPLPFSVLEILNDYGYSTKKCVVVGDQLLTDVILGKWLKMYTILVDPIDKKSFFIKTLQRDVELFILRWIQKW